MDVDHMGYGSIFVSKTKCWTNGYTKKEGSDMRQKCPLIFGVGSQMAGKKSSLHKKV
jgi:hypothetical protein